KRWLGADKPENVVKINDTTFWVIEAKNEHKALSKATGEAEDYAKRIQQSRTIKAVFISGVAGNDADGYLVQTRIFRSGKFQPIKINGKEITALISREIADLVLRDGPVIRDMVVNEALFLNKAEKINQILHLGA